MLAVDDVTAVAQPGEVTALLGPKGAGKTTTLRMLLGLVAPSSGTATWVRQLADESRTVLLSSHALSEVELTADHVLVPGSWPALSLIHI